MAKEIFESYKQFPEVFSKWYCMECLKWHIWTIVPKYEFYCKDCMKERK